MKKPFKGKLSAKKTALSQDAPKPTIDMPSAAAPKAPGERESETSPRAKPKSAASPGRMRTEPNIKAMIRKSIDVFHARSGRTV